MSLVTAAKQRWFLTFDEIIVFTSPPRHRRNGHCRCKGLAKSSWSMTHNFGLLKNWDNSPSNKNKERMATSAASLSQRPYYWLSDSLKSQPSWPKVVKSMLMEHINIPGVCVLSCVGNSYNQLAATYKPPLLFLPPNLLWNTLFTPKLSGAIVKCTAASTYLLSW